MKKAELREYEQQLLAIHRRISGNHADLSVDTTGDIVDLSTASDAVEMNANEESNNAARKVRIEEALARVRAKTYGICEDCEGEISRLRLSAIPEVRNCVQCQRDAEKNGEGVY